MRGRALVSVHDFAPETLPEVLEILGLLRGWGVPPPTLLVVPGRRWTGRDLATLRRLESEGHRLAGHGWDHRAPVPRTFGHRLHALLVSRDRGEHLSRHREEIRSRILRCFRWFGEKGLRTPDLHVPPAWAMGGLTSADLRTLPFTQYEVLSGLVDGRTGERVLLPLVGFEADTLTRKVALKVLNSVNLAVARTSGLPLRIAIHPQDLHLLLRKDLRRLLRNPWNFATEKSVLGSV